MPYFNIDAGSKAMSFASVKAGLKRVALCMGPTTVGDNTKREPSTSFSTFFLCVLCALCGECIL